MSVWWVLLLLKSTAVLNLGTAVAWLFRNRSAAARHLVWWSTLATLLILPAGMLLNTVAPEGWTIPVAAGAVGGPRVSAAAAGASKGLAVLWTIGFVVMVARLSAAARRAIRLVRGGRAAPAWNGVAVRVAHDTPTAAAWSFGGDIILLPSDAENWPEERLNAALRHERAHLTRRDSWALLTAELACAVYWFHPLAWYAAHRLRVEQEHAADDQVVGEGLAASEYAGHLVKIAAAERGGGLLAAAGARSMLGARIESILDKERNRNMLNRRMIVASLAAVALVGVPLAAMQADAGVYSVKDAGVTPPKLIEKHEPDYTAAAKDNKIEGAVDLSVVIASDGSVSEVTVKRGLDPGLDANAVNAIKSWKFKPAEKDGKPVAVRASVEVNFKLK